MRQEKGHGGFVLICPFNHELYYQLMYIYHWNMSQTSDNNKYNTNNIFQYVDKNA